MLMSTRISTSSLVALISKYPKPDNTSLSITAYFPVKVLFFKIRYNDSGDYNESRRC